MRIILIPGLGEDETIFDQLAPLLPGEKIVLNSWKIAGNTNDSERNALTVASELVAELFITQSDVVIGHSMGGKIALYIKHSTGCTVVQISSWTDERRIYWPVIDHAIVYWLVKKGLIFTPFAQHLLMQLFYKRKPSKNIFRYITNLLMNGNKNNVNNQLRIIFKKVSVHPSVQPNLRIHGLKDTIVRPPKEPFHAVAGDHFALYTHWDQVANPIINLLQKIEK